MIAAIYARKSTDDSDRDAEARSCERQIEHARQYAAAQGWTVDERHVYRDDAVSGAEWKHRPGFNALLAALEPRAPFGVLIVSELSRIARDTVRTPVAVLQIEEAGVEIHSYLNRGPDLPGRRGRRNVRDARRAARQFRAAEGQRAHTRRAQATV